MVASPPKSVAVKVLLIVVAVVVPTLVFRQIISGQSKPATLGNQTTSSANTQTDIEEGIKVVATYLPSESSSRELAFNIELSSVGPDLSSYDAVGHIVLANDAIAPLRTLKSSYTSRSKAKVETKMIFEKTTDTHYHILVQDLAGVGERVLHFYF